jgi:hypothetical protein
MGGLIGSNSISDYLGIAMTATIRAHNEKAAAVSRHGPWPQEAHDRALESKLASRSGYTSLGLVRPGASFPANVRA